MEYNYQDNTLLHGIGFNFAHLESILKYGIVSCNEAKREKITYTKNYDVLNNNNDDYISCIRVGDIPLTDLNSKNSAYAVYTVYGINFIIEDVEIEDTYAHRLLDEVLVKDKIPLTKIKGLAIPKEYLNVPVFGVRIIPRNITKYEYLKDIVFDYIAFLNKYGSKINKRDVEIYLIEALYINKEIAKTKEEQEDEYLELIKEYEDILKDLNELLASVTYDVFSRLLNKSVTIEDLVNYLTHNSLMISNIPNHFFMLTKGVSLS